MNCFIFFLEYHNTLLNEKKVLWASLKARMQFFNEKRLITLSFIIYFPSSVAHTHFCVFMGRTTKNECGQYSAILTEKAWSITHIYYMAVSLKD